MTQKVLAKAAGISQPSLSDIENDETKGEDLKAATLIGLSRALKCDAEYLLIGSGDPLQFQLMDIYRKLSEDGRDELLGKANRIYSKEHPGDLSAHPFAPLPKRKQTVKERT